jgi:peptide chain release factor 1
VISVQEERSQLQNREKAMRYLRARLLKAEQERQQREEAEARRAQVGTGERAEKIRTYNFPQSRVTDHRISVSKNLPTVLEGGLDEFIEALAVKERSEQLGKKDHD